MANAISRRSITYDLTFNTTDSKKAASDVGKELDKIGGSIDKVANEITEFSEKTTSAVQRLRAIKNELNNFKGSEERFRSLTIEAAKLQDQLNKTNDRIRTLASSTKNIQALISVAQGLTGVFTAAQGAVALFGNKNEDLTRTLVKLQGSLAILQGLQAAIATVTEQSAAKTVILANAKKVYTFVTQGATVATRIFNAALAATIGGAIIAGIIALVAYWKDIAKWIGIAKEEQKSFAETSDELLAKNTAAVDRIKSKADLAELSTKDLNTELSRLKEKLEEIPREGLELTLPNGQTVKQDMEGARKELGIQISKIERELEKRKIKKQIEVLPIDRNGNEIFTIDDILPKDKEEIIIPVKFEAPPEAPPTNESEELDEINAKIKEQANLRKELNNVINITGNSLATVAGLAKQGSELQMALAISAILVNQAQAISAAIKAGAEFGATTGPAALIATPTAIATLIGGVISTFAQVFSVINQAKAAQAKANAFAEGAVDIHAPGEIRGKDSIPATLMPGESVITTEKTSKYKPFLRAIHEGTLEDLIRVNYVEPALAISAMEQAQKDSSIDYSQRFYKQLLATHDGNSIGKRTVQTLERIERKIGNQKSSWYV